MRPVANREHPDPHLKWAHHDQGLIAERTANGGFCESGPLACRAIGWDKERGHLAFLTLLVRPRNTTHVAGAAATPLPILGPMLSGGPTGYGGEAAPRILIVDDDPNLLVLLADQLRADGYEIQTARDGDEALRRLRTGWPDLLIIDMMMPRMDGLTLAREIKGRADLPIIVLSAIDAGDSKADLLEEVAEDYVTKPYHYPELRARINRVLRRLGDKVPRQSLVLGPNLTLDLHRREATVGGETVQLTPTESRLLYALAANLGQTVTTETLLARGWAETEDADPSYVWVTMRRLRQKVEVDPNRPVHLQTVRGVGYRLVAAGGAGRVGRAARRPSCGRPPATPRPDAEPTAAALRPIDRGDAGLELRRAWPTSRRDARSSEDAGGGSARAQPLVPDAPDARARSRRRSCRWPVFGVVVLLARRSPVDGRDDRPAPAVRPRRRRDDRRSSSPTSSRPT